MVARYGRRSFWPDQMKCMLGPHHTLTGMTFVIERLRDDQSVKR